jgi:hypothetical protein
MRFCAPVVLVLIAAWICAPAPVVRVFSICELAKDFPAFHGRVVAVRGIYYGSVVQKCPEQRAVGSWPSSISVYGGNSDAVWEQLAKTLRNVQSEAKHSTKRFEIWVTVVGRLQSKSRHYGHLGASPAQIDVVSFRDIEVKENPASVYDYANMYTGPA